MQKFSKYLPIALFLGFFLIGFNVFLESKPQPKNKRVYEFVKKYSPYYIQKRFGGLTILSKEDKEFKEKPSSMEFFKKLQELESAWAKNHLKLQNNTLLIIDNNKTLDSLKLQNKKEIDFIKSYYKVN
jgi:hypothetical protein